MRSFKGADIISIEDLSREEIDRILAEAKWLLGVIERQTSLKLLAGKVLATLFYQTSTRTRLSVESAMQRLGGKCPWFCKRGIVPCYRTEGGDA